MAKSSGGGESGNDNNNSGSDADGADGGDRIQQQIRDFAQKAADLAQNPVARTMIAAGLVTAAAAITANKKVRDNAKKAGRDAVDSAEDAAEAAGRIGTAVVSAAADAFRKVMNLGGEEDSGASSSSKEDAGAKSRPAKSGAATKSKTQKAPARPARRSRPGRRPRPRRPELSPSAGPLRVAVRLTRARRQAAPAADRGPLPRSASERGSRLASLQLDHVVGADDPYVGLMLDR
jgi:hypothetical protein